MDNEATTNENPTQTDGSTNDDGGSILTNAADPEATGDQQGDQAKQDKQDEVKEPEGAPEAYDLKLPEGAEAAAPVIEEFKPLAKELGLTNEKAQKLVDFYTKTVNEAKEQQWKEIRTGWIDTAKKDQEYGGQKFSESVGMAKKAMDQFGTPELKQMLDSYGMGDHPEMIRLMVRVGRSMAEDKIVTGQSQGRPKTAEELLYGS